MAYRSIPRPCKICGKMIKGGMGVSAHMRVHQKEGD